MPHDDFTALYLLPPVDPSTLPPLRSRTDRQTPHATGVLPRASPQLRGLDPLQRLAPQDDDSLVSELELLPVLRLPSDLWRVGWSLPVLVSLFWWLLVEHLQVQHPHMRILHALGAGLTTLASVGVVLAFTG